MFILYRACANETNMQMKIAAASQGAEVDFDDDWFDPAPPEVINKTSLSSIPIGLMIEEV